MNATIDDPVLPRKALLAIGAVLLTTFLGAAAVRLTGTEIRTENAPVLQMRELRFEDRRDGGVDVIDAASQRVIHSMAGENGFFRGALRGLARERKRNGMGPERPFELSGHADGRLTLLDPTTGTRLDLGSFGPTNAAVFAQFLTDAPAPR
jgi:putative photosynthetic complex assembly protein